MKKTETIKTKLKLVTIFLTISIILILFVPKQKLVFAILVNGVLLMLYSLIKENLDKK